MNIALHYSRMLPVMGRHQEGSPFMTSEQNYIFSLSQILKKDHDVLMADSAIAIAIVVTSRCPRKNIWPILLQLVLSPIGASWYGCDINRTQCGIMI